jgi:glycosyltransferase involved in cell wall biosynthesis
MAVLQVLGLLSADSAYGGPTGVALGQCRALEELGHRPTLLTGWDGRASAPAAFPVHRRRAYKLSRRSFASLVSPAALLWFAARARTFDVVHVHLARDLLTLPLAGLALIFRVPLVVQSHGMVVPDDRWVVKLLDRLVTRRVLRSAAVVLALTELEAEQLRALGVPPERLARLSNSIFIPEERAGFAERSPLVVYLSRLAERKRPVAFVRMAAAVAARRSDARFEIWGPDEGQLSAVEEAITELGLGERCTYRGATGPGEGQRILSGAQVMVLPSVAEPLPLVVLEALSLGLPAVITTDTGLSELLHASTAAMVTDGSPGEMAAAVLALLDSEPAWKDVSDAALTQAVDRFAPDAVARALADHYERAAAERRW